MASRRFKLVRTEDVNGNSGTGDVAEGVEFSNGMVAITFLSEHRGATIWDCIRSPKHLHGHEGKTKLVWLDPPEIDDEEMVEEYEDSSNE